MKTISSNLISAATVIVMIFIYSNSHSQLLEENFEYPDGALLTDHGWTASSGTDTNNITTVAPGLEFDNFGLGLCAQLNRTGQDVYKNFNTQSEGSLYATMIVKVDSVNMSEINGRGNIIAAFLPANSTSDYYARLWIRKSGSGVAFGISKTSFEAGGIFFTGAYPLNTTHLLVLKYTFDSVSISNDKVDLFVFTSSLPPSEPINSTVYNFGTDDDATDLGKFALIQEQSEIASNVLKIDGISVSTSWNQVLPVELSSFTSYVNKNNVHLNWTTSGEYNNAGFEIERKLLNNNWINAGFVKGKGTSRITNTYSFTDKNLGIGKYSYRLKQIDFNGNFEYFNLYGSVLIGAPVSFELFQNYPNPFNPVTTISFQLPAGGFTQLSIHDSKGTLLENILNENLSEGYYNITYNAENISSGVYFYRLSINGNSVSRKMIVTK